MVGFFRVGFLFLELREFHVSLIVIAYRMTDLWVREVEGFIKFEGDTIVDVHQIIMIGFYAR